MNRSKPQFDALTGVRFFLALWVVVFHQSNADGAIMGSRINFGQPILTCLIRTGYVAVGVFFALSGFVLAYNYSLDIRWSPRNKLDFAVARLARIYPAYATGLLLMAPLVISTWPYGHVNMWIKPIVEALLNATLLQSWIPRHALTWNMPGWSLSAEAFFYVSFPAVGVILWRASRKWDSAILLLLVTWGAALVFPTIAILKGIPGFTDIPATADNLRADPFWANLFKLNPLVRFPEFCFGIVILRLYTLSRTRFPNLNGKGYLLYLPGLLLEGIVISTARWIPFPLFHNGILLPLHGLVILGLAFRGGPIETFLSTPVLKSLGNASYAMYILHWPVFEWMTLFWQHRFGRPMAGLIEFGIYASTVILLSAVVHRAIEEPSNRAIKQFWKNRRPQVTPTLQPLPESM
jgi:peptidoglycan/LPS O-acetylase OafA/YrhL